MKQRHILKWLALTGFLLCGGVESLQAAPNLCSSMQGQTIRWIVPNSPGGGYDTYSRLIAPHLAGKTGTRIVVQNMPGAGGIIGAGHIRDAPVDGLTVGILNGPGMLIASLIGEKPAPNPLTDFTILGRVARSRHVWATGARSPFRTIDELLEHSRESPVLFAIDEVATTSFVSSSLGASLLQMEIAFLSGFPGGRQTTLAAVRGDVDLVSHSYESVRDLIEAGDLRPLLQISESPISEDPALEGVPLLGGATGLAVRFAALRGESADTAEKDSGAVINLVGAGRLAVAPGGLALEPRTCLVQGLNEALTSPEFIADAAKAKRSLAIAGPDEVLAELQFVSSRSLRFLPILERALEKARR